MRQSWYGIWPVLGFKRFAVPSGLSRARAYSLRRDASRSSDELKRFHGVAANTYVRNGGMLAVKSVSTPANQLEGL